MTKTLAMVIAGIITAVVVITVPVYSAQAQQQTAVTAAVRSATSECGDSNDTNSSILPEECAAVLHESANTVVLNGDVLLTSYSGQRIGIPNIFFWQAVDSVKALGYSIDSVMLGGVGSVGNPNEYYVVMSK